MLSHLSLPLSLLLLTSVAFAQAPVVVLSPGDLLPNGDTVRIIWAAEIAAGGEWIARVDTNRATGGIGGAVLTSEGNLMAIGDDVPGLPGATIQSLTHIARDDQGRTYCQMSVRLVNGAMRSLLHSNFTSPLLDQDDEINGILIPEINDIEVNSSGTLLVNGRFMEATHTPTQYRGIAALQVSGGAVTSVVVLVDGSVPPPGQFAPIHTFWTGEDNYVLGDAGGLAWAANLSGSPATTVAYDLAGNLLLKGGTPSPIPGRLWATAVNASFDINASGSLLMAADIDGSISDDELYVLDGVVVRREGDPVPGQAGLSFRILDRVVNLSDGGDLIHWAVLNGLPNSSNAVVMMGDQILVREGATLTSTGETIAELTSTTRATADGRWILFKGWLAGDASSRLMLVESKPVVGAAYCSAEPNSTGQFALTCAYGSDVVQEANVRLSCTAMPANTFGYFLASRTQGNVLFPGGSAGRLCLGGAIARFVSLAQNSGVGGIMDVAIDLTSIPVSPPTAVLPGETWNFQAWFRDFGSPPTSNFAQPTSVTFQ
ncbi:hypothetical protein Poly30_48230 [Planctomycetes bacterium Poly30]|uniref:Uncharacterized protein n=1 Tax=Saltatorellus ferox TaxID=2528018 RepID=A0A518EYV1_9BACT|nr:hypothetical protein Poly30_48230 [Planctomycetes bacterium Poly30]